jgi:hypothetical protein
MDAGFKGPVFHHNNLFVIRGYDVLLYVPNGNALEFTSVFPFPDPVEKLEGRSTGLVVKTAHSYHLIGGGPLAESYYAVLIGDFADSDQVLSDDLSCLIKNNFPNQNL